MSRVAEVIEGKVAAKLREKKGQISGIVVLDIDGPEGGKWTLDCDKNTIENKDTETPNVRIRMSDRDFIDMMNGVLNPATAMFSGRLKIEGDMAMASKLAMAIR